MASARAATWVIALGGLVAVAAPVRAQNLVANPSAEEVGNDGTPRGWGIYRGAGGAWLGATSAARHGGARAAQLTLSRWGEVPGAATTKPARTASAAFVLAPNDGYRAAGALAGVAGTTYVLSFWYRGDVPAATVGVTGWPRADSGYRERRHQVVPGGALRPGAAWRRFTGSFRLAAGVRRFVVTVQVGGAEGEGARLGTLLLDDVELTAKVFPDGQLRGIWMALPAATGREAGRRAIARALDRVAAAGLNTVFLWVESRYAAALERPARRAAEPRAAWDAVGEVLAAARSRRLEVHLWYSPFIYKERWRAPELREHPEWAAVNAAGVPDPAGLCFVRPEVRRYELALIARLLERYPGFRGVHLEEPGHDWGEYCSCSYCRRRLRREDGVDLARDPAAARPLLDHLAAAASTDFVVRLRQLLETRWPGRWLSANGSAGPDADRDWRLGRDWVTWARRGYLDFYVPQVYTDSLAAFRDGARRTRDLLGDCPLVAGLAISWSGIAPARLPPPTITAQVRAAAEVGARGFVVFRLEHALPAHLDAVRAALRRP